jgi:uncharacterized protein (TIGR03083 family)
MDEMLREAAQRAAAVIRQAPDGAAPVKGLQWTVAETAAHLLSEFHDYAAIVSGAATVSTVDGQQSAAQQTSAANAQQLVRLAERDLARLADALPPAVDAFIAANTGRDPAATLRAPNGVLMTPATMSAALLGELLVHGFDIARATGQPWSIPAPEATEVVGGVMAMLPDYLDRQRAAGRTLSYEVRLRGGPRYRIAIANGAAEVGGAGPAVDCVITANPVAFLLVGYGRVGQLGQALRGRILAGGRKPWLGFAFGQLVTGP